MDDCCNPNVLRVKSLDFLTELLFFYFDWCFIEQNGVLSIPVLFRTVTTEIYGDGNTTNLLFSFLSHRTKKSIQCFKIHIGIR